MGRARAFFTLLLLASLLTAGVLGGCGGGGSSSETQAKDASVSLDAPSLPSTDATFLSSSDDAAASDDGGPAVTSLTIVPQNPEVDVTVANGQVVSVTLAGDGGAASPLTFIALGNGSASVAAAWAFDRGELGMMSAAGAFTPGTTYAGQGTVTAVYGRLVATTKLTLKISSTQNGGPNAGASDAGTDAGALSNLGGNNGVGGNLLGGPVDPTTLGRLNGPGTAPTSAQQLGWLYPYDKTVWPRGILAPLLQWQTTASVTAVRIHLSEANFDFSGTYAGTALLVNDPNQQGAWAQATGFERRRARWSSS